MNSSFRKNSLLVYLGVIFAITFVGRLKCALLT